MFTEGKEHDRKMKIEIHRDHIAEMLGGDNYDKNPHTSEFNRAFGT